MLFAFFKNKELDEFAKTAIARFAERCPVAVQAEASVRGDQKREAAIRVLHSDVVRLHKSKPLGVYRKAYMANGLKWEMKERGYAKDFVNAVVYDLLIELAGKK
jgi:hypothetical protein